MFTHNCVDQETCLCACSRTKRRVCAHFFWLTKSCLCITFNIWLHVCHQMTNRRSRNDVQPYDLTYEHFLVYNFPHTKSYLEHWFDPHEGQWCVFTVKRRPSPSLFDLHGCVRVKILSCEHVSVYNLLHNFLCLCLTDMFPRSMSITRPFHTLWDGCLPGGRHRRSFVPQHKIDSSHRSVVRCWPWPGASPPGPGREKVINHKILIIKGTTVDLAVRQLYL